MTELLLVGVQVSTNLGTTIGLTEVCMRSQLSSVSQTFWLTN